MNEEELLRAHGLSPTLVREAFGRLAPCRHCEGRGKIRHRANAEEAAERTRLRRRGQAMPPPPPFDPCAECGGRGYLPIESADTGNPPPDGWDLER